MIQVADTSRLSKKMQWNHINSFPTEQSFFTKHSSVQWYHCSAQPRGMTKKRVLASVGAYALVVNAGSAYLFYFDKQIAVQNERLRQQQMRIPEKVLCLSAVLGGWIGGMCVFLYRDNYTDTQACGPCNSFATRQRNRASKSCTIRVPWQTLA